MARHTLFFFSLSLSFPLSLALSLSFCLSPLEEFRSGAVTLNLLTTLGHKQEYIVVGFVMEDPADLGFFLIYIYFFFALNFVCQSVRLREVLKCLGKVFAFGS